MMKQIETSITIQAPAARVWQLLTTLEDYSRWNPFIVASSGSIRPGAHITNTMLMGEKRMTFKPKIGKVVDGTAFEWTGNLLFPGLFDGNHYFQIIPEGAQQVRLIHGERFSGLLSGLLLKSIGAQTLQQFEAMNQALKHAAEAP